MLRNQLALDVGVNSLEVHTNLSVRADGAKSAALRMGEVEPKLTTARVLGEARFAARSVEEPQPFGRNGEVAAKDGSERPARNREAAPIPLEAKLLGPPQLRRSEDLSQALDSRKRHIEKHTPHVNIMFARQRC